MGLTFLVGLRLDATGERLGTPLPPMAFGVDVGVRAGWLALAAAVLAGTIAAAPRLRGLAPGPFALALLALALVTRLAVGAVRWGPEGWDEPWNESFNAKNEYVPALGAVEVLGVRFFLDRFDELLPALPVHAAGHPPGFLLTLHALGLDTPGAASALAIGLGALAVPATYALARRLLDEDRARTAGLLSALACGTTLYGVTTADVVYAAMGAGAALLLVGSARVTALGGAAALALASFFSYAVLAIGAWAAIVRFLRDGWRSALAMSMACAAALVALYGALWALTGFEIQHVLVATEETYRESVARMRPYAFWLFGSPAAFFAFLGLPITWYAARALGAGHPVAIALAAVVVVSAVGGFTKAETERIWLMFAPLACVAAAAVLPRARLTPVLVLLAVQTLTVEVVFGTVW